MTTSDVEHNDRLIVDMDQNDYNSHETFAYALVEHF